jgi:hypothetical protein
VWAFIGIAVRQSDTSAVMITAILAAVVVAVVLAISWLRRTQLKTKLA